VKSKLVAFALVFLMLTGVFAAAPVSSLSVSAVEVVGAYGFGFGGGPVTPCGDPVPGMGPGGD